MRGWMDGMGMRGWMGGGKGCRWMGWDGMGWDGMGVKRGMGGGRL